VKKLESSEGENIKYLNIKTNYYLIRTGSGKSTLVTLLTRLYEIENKNNSRILIDDIDTKLIDLNVLRKGIAILP
jgi:ABC-type multidrug transport system fused ATPase/permease subunit